MSEHSFFGYMRSDGSAGVRNYVLILPIHRSLKFIASMVERMTRGTLRFDMPAETGRPKKDRETIARTLIGLMKNPNVGGIVILAESSRTDSSYPNMESERFLSEADALGKPWRAVYLTNSGGAAHMIGDALLAAREVLVQASRTRRTECPLSALSIGVKCGITDATSGLAGNPCVGAAVDRIVSAGGTAFFSETTEIIGAEDHLAVRAVTPEGAKMIRAAARRWEEKALASGEDVRAINLIPASQAAGLSSLEEKSLGAISKSGHLPIEGVLRYGEHAPTHGLWFVDAWMASLSLPLSFAANGAALVIFQMGGGAMPTHPMLPVINPGLVSPLVYVTGNPRTYEKSPENFDFDASAIMTEARPVEEVGEKLLELLLDIASGTMTKAETLDYDEQLEMYLEGPVL